MKFERKRWLLLDAHYSFSVGGIQLLAEGDWAQPETITKVKLRGVATTRVRHWKEKPDERMKNNCQSPGRNERDKRATFVWLLSCVLYSREGGEKEEHFRDHSKTGMHDVRQIRENIARAIRDAFSFSGKIFSRSLLVATRMLRFGYVCFITFFSPSSFSSNICHRLHQECNKISFVSSSPRGLDYMAVGGRFIVSYVKRLVLTTRVESTVGLRVHMFANLSPYQERNALICYRESDQFCAIIWKYWYYANELVEILRDRNINGWNKTYCILSMCSR